MSRKKAYRAYLRSPAWQARRRLALAAAGHRCQACAATTRLDVHHLSYAHFGAEPPADLAVLCRPCHEAAHEAKLVSELAELRRACHGAVHGRGRGGRVRGR